MSDIKKLASSWIMNWFFGFNQIPTDEDCCIYMKPVYVALKQMEFSHKKKKIGLLDSVHLGE